MADRMFGVTFKSAKEGFFDHEKVKKAMDEATQKNLSKFGAWVMTQARRSMRRTKKSSSPGEPPKAHVGLIKEGQHAVEFWWDFNSRSVVIGPTLINRSSVALKTLEHGGDEMLSWVWRTKNVGAKKKRWLEKSPSYTAHYAPFPFMQPAYDENLAKLQPLWANSIKW